MNIITTYRFENLHITDHMDLNLTFNTSVTDHKVNFAFSQITDFKQGTMNQKKGPAISPLYQIKILSHLLRC